MPGSGWKIRHGNKHWAYNYRPISQKNTKEPISDQTVKNLTPGFHIAGEEG